MSKKEIIILIVGIAFAIGAGALTYLLQTGAIQKYFSMEKDSQENITEENTENNTENNKTFDPNFSQNTMPKLGDTIAVIETNIGVIKFILFEEKAPKTVENFRLLAERGYYEDIIFHRVIKDFMIQTGDPTGTGMGGESAWGGKFADEFHPNLKNLYGAVSMANGGADTNGSQFFIVQSKDGTPWLDNKHSVFGQVFEGMDIVDKIASVETDSSDKPLDEIRMIKVSIEKFQE